MRIAYLDCPTGISGDMTLAALIDAGVDLETLRAGIDSLGLADVRLDVETVMRGAFRGVHVKVVYPPQHVHRGLKEILELIDRADAITANQKELARRIFFAVAAAEAKVHGSTIAHVHFHEVGAVDSIVDIIGAAIGFDLLGVEQIYASPIPTGQGVIRIAHGICPIPAPGTAELLKGIPLADVPIESELTTPTGAAIVATLVDRFSSLPEMTIESIGYGAGTKEFKERANLLRLFVGTGRLSEDADQIVLIETNLDDISGEIVGYTKQKLFAAGALDVYTIPIQMKKERPGVMLCVLGDAAHVDRLESIIFDETKTFGLRRSMVQRSKRARSVHRVTTEWGTVQGKLGWRNGGKPLFVPEYEECARVAEAQNIPLWTVYRAAEQAFLQLSDDAVSELMSTSPQIVPNIKPPVHETPAFEHDYRHDHDHDGHDHDHS
ncbi:MAG: nickel pincer cofactor biosynthesis protein LarC [Planctomycetota bacterium]|nr:nickel pincer cofactor biosynthesis protein LarC [Planctomycetota bacterium]MDA1215161.1 nickel pincer cofactor biosynthesis protein LarC [Planctomycetota bacterium]